MKLTMELCVCFTYFSDLMFLNLFYQFFCKYTNEYKHTNVITPMDPPTRIWSGRDYSRKHLAKVIRWEKDLPNDLLLK